MEAKRLALWSAVSSPLLAGADVGVGLLGEEGEEGHHQKGETKQTSRVPNKYTKLA